MSIMTRFVRLCKADIHGVMDHLEDKDLLMKQLLRDMDEEIARKEGRLRKTAGLREQVQKEYEAYGRECEKLDNDVTAAVRKDKDDIARMLIKKLKPLAAHREELALHSKSLDEECAQLRTIIAEQRLQYDQMQVRCREYLRGLKREEWEEAAALAGLRGRQPEPSPEEIEIELLKRKDAHKGGARS